VAEVARTAVNQSYSDSLVTVPPGDATPHEVLRTKYMLLEREHSRFKFRTVVAMARSNLYAEYDGFFKWQADFKVGGRVLYSGEISVVIPPDGVDPIIDALAKTPLKGEPAKSEIESAEKLVDKS
jgi:hypothetical protein